MKVVGTSDNFRSATSRPLPARSRPYRACPREKLSEVPTTSPTGAETARPRSGRLPYGGEGSTPPLPARLFCGRRADCGAYSPCSEGHKMTDYQPKSPEALFAELKDAVRGVAEQQMPSLRIALDVEPREFELDYSGGTISLSTPDGSPVHPGIRHIANFWMKMLSLPASPASIQRLHRSEENTSELQSLLRISYAVFC